MRRIKFLILGIVLLILSSCYWKPEVVTIFKGQIKLSKTPTVIELTKPLYRTKNLAEIHLSLSRKWYLENTDGNLKFENDEIATINITIIDTNGHIYIPKGYGSSGNNFCAFFSYLPKNIKIVTIKVTSSIEIDCKEISWFCVNPI